MAKPKGGSPKQRRRFRPSTDSGNAALFAKLHGDEIRYVRNWNKWLVWGGQHWRLDHNNVYVTGLAKDVSPQLLREANAMNSDEDRQARARWAKASGNRAKISAMVDLVRDLDDIAISHDELDRNSYLFGVKNGVIDLRTGELRDGDPADLMMMASPVTFDPKAKARRWRRAMKEWFPDVETRDYVQRLAGAALIGEQRDHILVIHYGDGGNGKGTFVRAIAHVLGEYFVTPHMSLLVEQKHSQHGTEKAKLFRTRLAVAAETEHRQRLNEAEVKNLTGGDRIAGRRMREDPWEFDPSHSLWLQTNYMPEIRGRDSGIWRRIRVVPWNVEFAGKKKDPDLDRKLSDEAPGILNWLIEGALAYQEAGLDEPAAVKKPTAEYRDAEDILGRFQAETGLVFEKSLMISAANLARELAEWCETEGIHDVPSARDTASWLRDRGAVPKRKRIPPGKNPVTVWQGIDFREDG
jgi:putative DNA primase/helicase